MPDLWTIIKTPGEMPGKHIKKYNKLAMDGVQEEVDFPVFLYTGYLCANIETVENCMSEAEFFDKLPENHATVIGTVMKLRYGESKKKPDLNGAS